MPRPLLISALALALLPFLVPALSAANPPGVRVQPLPLPPGTPRGGEATLRCQVAKDGYLTNCSVDSESPGQDWGQQALRLVQMAPDTYRADPEKFPVGSWVKFPIRFDPVD